jgi:YVTN family beta-propeller protein
MSTFQGDLAHGKRCGHGRWLSAALAAGAFVCVTCPSWPAAADGRSTNIALDHSGSLLFVANRLADSLTVFEVNGSSLEKLTEVGVGNEPICVAVAGKTAYVANAESGTVSVVEETGGGFAVVEEIEVGTEPRGCALGAGGRLFVTNFTEGTVAVVDTGSGEVEDVIDVGGNPYGVTTVGHNVFVTQFFARLIDGGPGEGFDDGKEGVLLRLRANNPDQIKEIILSPLADSGFTANRVNLCTNLNPLAVNDTFCPDPTVTDPTDPAITMDPQAVHPNQLKTALACKGFLYLPNVGAQPEPPVQFTTNVQALVHVVSIGALAERKGRTVNLNQQIALEEEPDDPTSSLARLFGNELVAIDADSDCKNFFLVSRGGNYVIKARLVGGKLNIDAPDNVVRFQTGNIPNGIVVDSRGRRAASCALATCHDTSIGM